jgi:hypothetical protein
MSLKKIRLEMARTSEFPEGNPRCGYDFAAPLDETGKLDEGEWHAVKSLCTVHRFSDDAGDEYGMLRHHRGKWVFSYRPGEDDEEPIFRLDKHVFRPGEYVSVTEHDGRTYPFRVASVRGVLTAKVA